MRGLGRERFDGERGAYLAIIPLWWFLDNWAVVLVGNLGDEVGFWLSGFTTKGRTPKDRCVCVGWCRRRAGGG